MHNWSLVIHYLHLYVFLYFIYSLLTDVFIKLNIHVLNSMDFRIYLHAKNFLPCIFSVTFFSKCKNIASWLKEIAYLSLLVLISENKCTSHLIGNYQNWFPFVQHPTLCRMAFLLWIYWQVESKGLNIRSIEDTFFLCSFTERKLILWIE